MPSAADEIQKRWFDRQLEAKDTDATALKGGGGGGTSDEMEARVTKLESDMTHLVKQVDRLADVPTDMAVLKARLDDLPTKDWMTTRLQIYLAMMVAVTVLAVAITKLF